MKTEAAGCGTRHSATSRCGANRAAAASLAAAALILAACGTTPQSPAPQATVAPVQSQQVRPETTQQPTRPLSITCAVLASASSSPGEITGAQFRLWVHANTTTRVSVLTIVAFNSAGGELGSSDEPIGTNGQGEVIVAGQTLTFWINLPSDLLTDTGSTDASGAELYTTDATNCQVVGYS